MMKSLVAFAFLLATCLASAQPPRVAVLRVHDVFRQLEATIRANEILKAKREEISKDQRLAAHSRMISDLDLRRKQLAAANSKLDAAARRKLEREYAIKSREANSLRADFESFHAERTREINAEMVAGMKERLLLIRETAEKIGRDEGFDWILDSSGNTNTGVPLLLYAKKANDITDRVIATLAGPPPAASTTTRQPDPPKTGNQR
jgi:Skp family chaperone for outer membrane proteins